MIWRLILAGIVSGLIPEVPVRSNDAKYEHHCDDASHPKSRYNDFFHRIFRSN